jgi:hypothetical protein
MIYKIALMSMILFVASSCSGNDTYTLYRDSGQAYRDAGGQNARHHIATFDQKGSRGSDTYNLELCETAADLFGKEYPSLKYWCELGTFKK